MRNPITIMSVTAALLLSACGGGGGDWDQRLGEILSNETDTPEQRITSLEAYLDDEPPVELASEARFTVGWIYAETLQQYPEARRWFQDLLAADPSGPWSDEATWMLENMEKADSELLPGLEEQFIPPGTESPRVDPPPSGSP